MADGDRPAGPTAIATSTAATSTPTEPTSHRHGSRTGCSGVPSSVFVGGAGDVVMSPGRLELRPGVDEGLEVVDDARTPPARDVGIDLDDVIVLDGGQLVPARPVRDLVGRHAAVGTAVGQEDQVGIGADD